MSSKGHDSKKRHIAASKRHCDKIEAAQAGKYATSGEPLPKSDYETTIVIERYIKEFCKNMKKPRILDVGCRDGSFLAGFSGFETYGVDVCDPPPTFKKKCKKFVRQNIENGLPFGSDFFDVVSAQMIIEHLLDTDSFLSECNRVLKDGGLLILSTPNLASMRVIFRLLLGKHPDVISYSLHDGCRHLRYYTFGSLTKHLEQYNFKPVYRHGGILARRVLSKTLPLGARLKLFEVFPSLGGEIITAAIKIR